MLPFLADAEPPTPDNSKIVAISVIASSALTAVVMAVMNLYFRWKRGKTDNAREEATLRTDIAKADAILLQEGKRTALELQLVERERTTKIDMESHQQVVQQLMSIIEGYESRFKSAMAQADGRERTLVKQMEDRELQWQGILDEHRKENLECIRQRERAEARIEWLEKTAVENQNQIKDLQSRIEAQSTRRRSGQ